MKYKLILASESQIRLELLKKINVIPDIIQPANIDESPKPKELPHKLAQRLASEKANFVAQYTDNAIIIAADTVTACGRFILTKPETNADVITCLKKLSGRRSNIHTAVTIIKVTNGIIERQNDRLVSNIIKFKLLNESDINDYLASGEGIGKSGGICIEGIGAAFIPWLQGSISAMMGLPLYETRSLLSSVNYFNDKREG